MDSNGDTAVNQERRVASRQNSRCAHVAVLAPEPPVRSETEILHAAMSGDVALGELQRDLRIDRGPSSAPNKGIPYPSPEGFPYRIFDTAHADVLRDAAKLPQDTAARLVIETYLRAAVFVTPRKLSSMYRLLMTGTEVTAALERLEDDGRISSSSKYVSIRS